MYNMYNVLKLFHLTFFFQRTLIVMIISTLGASGEQVWSCAEITMILIIGTRPYLVLFYWGKQNKFERNIYTRRIS